MSDIAPAQEQSAPTPAPSESAQAEQASALQDQLATAKMTGQGKETIKSLEDQIVAIYAPKAQEPAQPETPVVPKEQQPEPPKEEPEKTEEESQTIEQPKTEEEPAAEEPVEPKDRIRMGKEYTDADKALVNAAHMLVKSGNAKTFTEAFARVSGLGITTQDEPEPEAPAIPVEITNLETEIAALEAKMDEAGNSEGLLNKDFTDLTKQLSKANAKLEAVRSRYENAAETQAVVSDATFEQQRADVLKATVKDYPQMTDKNSEQWKLARKLAKAASDPSDEDYQKAVSLEAPRYFADQAAKLLGIKPATATPSASPAKPTASTPNASPAKPGPAPGSRTSAPTPTVTKDQILAAADKVVADVLAGRGGPPKQKTPGYVMLG